MEHRGMQYAGPAGKRPARLRIQERVRSALQPAGLAVGLILSNYLQGKHVHVSGCER
jgi:hypothetical protein